MALLQQREQDLIETARQMKREVKFSNLDNVAEIIEVGNSRIILTEHLRLPAFIAAHRTLHLGVEKTIDAVAKVLLVTDFENGCNVLDQELH